MILEKLKQNREQVRKMGALAVESARKAGVPAYYRLRGSNSGEIVREMPDGKRQVVLLSSGSEIVVRTLKPRRR